MTKATGQKVDSESLAFSVSGRRVEIWVAVSWSAIELFLYLIRSAGVIPLHTASSRVADILRLFVRWIRWWVVLHGFVHRFGLVFHPDTHVDANAKHGGDGIGNTSVCEKRASEDSHSSSVRRHIDSHGICRR